MPADLRRQLLDAAYRLLAAGQQPPPVAFSVTVQADGATVVYAALPGEFGRGAGHDLAEIHRAILAACTAEPQPAKALARASGYSYSPRFRESLADLQRLGLVARTPDGLKLAPARP